MFNFLVLVFCLYSSSVKAEQQSSKCTQPSFAIFQCRRENTRRERQWDVKREWQQTLYADFVQHFSSPSTDNLQNYKTCRFLITRSENSVKLTYTSRLSDILTVFTTYMDFLNICVMLITLLWNLIKYILIIMMPNLLILNKHFINYWRRRSSSACKGRI